MANIAKFLLPLLIAAAPAAPPPQTVILVRHAERAGGTDPSVGLSEAGRCRSEILARMLADAHIQHIYVSDVARTQQTAQPLAAKLKLKPEAIPSQDVAKLVAEIRKGGTSLVVGHSNRLPEIIKQLGAGTVDPIDDATYDLMFIVTLTDPTHANLVTLHFAGCAP